MDRIRERIKTAASALTALQEVIGLENVSVIQRDAAIQRFEYTVEAIWKAARIYLLDEEGLDAASPKRVLRECHKVGLLSEEETALGLQMVDDRNLTSHTYHEGLAISIYSRLEDYARLMHKWLQAIEEHIGPGEERAECR